MKNALIQMLYAAVQEDDAANLDIDPNCQKGRIEVLQGTNNDDTEVIYVHLGSGRTYAISIVDMEYTYIRGEE